jgi:hypothetical protein
MKLLLTAAAVGLISAAVGGVVGYKIAERNLTVRFEERILKETTGMRVFYSQAKQPFDTPEAALAAMTEHVEELGGELEKIAYHKIVKGEYPVVEIPAEDSSPQVDFVPPPVDAHVQNIFDKPVVIPEDEFHAQESGYMQGTLTYYAQDGALCDEADQLIEAIDETVGQDNMLQFGYMSTDPSVVHVRNPKLQLEWEVIRNAGSYARDVQGMVDPPSGRGR